MLELHCNVLGSESHWTLTGQAEPNIVEDTVRLSFGTAGFSPITERDALEQIKAAMRRQKQDWIEPRVGDWRVDLSGIAKLIDTPAAVPWLTGTVSAQPEFSSQRRDVRDTACYTADFTFYFSPESNTQPATSMSLEVFISHSAKDGDVAEALIELLRAAMSIPHEKIRCSSVDGYRLPGGVTTDEQLKREVRESTCFIGLLTPNSLTCPYVLFELGARWGAQLHFVPLMARAITASQLRAPLSALNALTCASASQLHQLVAEIGKALGRELSSAAAYERHLQRLMAVANSETPTTASQPSGNDNSNKILKKEPVIPTSMGAKELLELIHKESDTKVRGIVEISKQLRPGEIHFFPRIQYNGNPLTAKSRTFREALDELIETGWLFPPEEHTDTNTRTYEYRGENGTDADAETVLVATAVDAPQLSGASTYPAGTPIPRREGFVLSPYAPSSGYVDVRGFLRTRWFVARTQQRFFVCRSKAPEFGHMATGSQRHQPAQTGIS